jgi:iduronate 2-sulfatase
VITTWWLICAPAVACSFARKIRRAYLGAIAYTDAQIGRVIAAVKAAGQEDNTIVSFIGDHGWCV